jgi:hypothetical protein
VAGCYEHDNEPSVSIKCGEFLDQLSDYKLLTKDSPGLEREGADWSHLGQEMDQWQAVVNTVMNVLYYKCQGIS